jgi:hypothetical protein
MIRFEGGIRCRPQTCGSGMGSLKGRDTFLAFFVLDLVQVGV